jgi:integrase
MECTSSPHTHVPWNKGKLVGQKTPLKPKEVWAIRTRLQMENRARELALFNLGIDSKLRACDLVKLRLRDVCHGDRVASRAIVLQQKTERPVQFEISRATREAVEAWIRTAGLRFDDYLLPSRVRRSPHLGTRQSSTDRWLSGQRGVGDEGEDAHFAAAMGTREREDLVVRASSRAQAHRRHDGKPLRRRVANWVQAPRSSRQLGRER